MKASNHWDYPLGVLLSSKSCVKKPSAVAGMLALLRASILDHASKILFDNDTQLLLTPKFWILPLYRELLNSARRIRPSPSSERARGCTGLVKVICKENKEQKGKRKYHAGTLHPNDRGGFTQWF